MLGSTTGGYNREECLRTVECYDPKTDRWTFIAPMRTPRARFQMAVLMVRPLCLREGRFVVCLFSIHQGDLSFWVWWVGTISEAMSCSIPSGSAVRDGRLKRPLGRVELRGDLQPA